MSMIEAKAAELVAINGQGLTAMSDLPRRLRIKASMIALGERIAWGSDTAIMEEAADMIEALSASVENHQLHMLGIACERDQLRATLDAQPQSAPAGEREAEAAAIAEEIDWLIRQWDAKASWSGERMAELLEAAGKASEMLAAWQRTQSAGVPDVSAMARVLSDRSADACNIDRTDNWAMYGQEYIEDVQAMLAAQCEPAPAQPAVQGEAVEVVAERITVVSITGIIQAVAATDYDSLKAERDRLQKELADLHSARSAQAERVEVVGYAGLNQLELHRLLPKYPGMKVKKEPNERYTEPLMTVAQHNRILAAAPAHSAERQEQGEVQRLRDWVVCVERLPADKRDVMVYCADSDEHMVGSSIGDGLFLFATASNGERVVCRPTHWRYIDESDKPDLAASSWQEVE